MSTKPKDDDEVEEKRPHPQHNEPKKPAAEPAVDPMSTPPDPPAPKEEGAA